MFSKSNDNGETFSMPDNISNNAETSINADISSEGANVYVVWDDHNRSDNEILFAESNDNGENFDMPDKLGNGTFFAQVPHVSSSTS